MISTKSKKDYAQIIGSNLSILMKNKDIDSKSISEATGIGLTTINNLRRGKGNPTIATIFAIAEFFNLTTDELINQGSLSTSENTGSKIITIPIVELDKLAIFERTNKASDVIKINLPLKSKKIFGVKINNNSFAPYYEKNSILITSIDVEPADGDIILCKLHQNTYTFKRLHIAKSGFYIFNIIGEREPELINNSDVFGVVEYAIIDL